MSSSGAHIHVTGIVQGVGFRPFVYALARRLALTGRVRNTSAGVEIDVDGDEAALDEFSRALRTKAPPLALIDSLTLEFRPGNGFDSFEIVPSESIAEAYQPIAPDASVCPDCLRELLDPRDRRYRYPFINCTNCGPRFTIIQDIPYDRPNTTMAGFAMCPECRSDYLDPLNRRFHAQPIACPQCGPQVWLEVDGETAARRDDAIRAARAMLRAGKIIAVKGLGGFHLACDATNAAAVSELRRRKLRIDKPFALMVADGGVASEHIELRAAELELLVSRERPIVIAARKPGSKVAAEVSPGQNTLGVMLPYTPLHHLLLEDEGARSPVLVMTSGNMREEPIATGNPDARERLHDLADAFLMHDRDIWTRCDDSVVRVYDEKVYPLRRSRGYAPFPVPLPFSMTPVLAAGAELKNAFCLTRDRYAFLSHHVGDLENFETLKSFQDGIVHFERLFHVRPQLLAYDLHLDYMATRYALERSARDSIPAVGVQHHHAHVAACMAENGLHSDERVIGVAFDGTGYGPDGAVWGGEFLIAGYEGYERPYHLAYVRLPGGERAIRDPRRVALAWLAHAGVEWSRELAPILATGGQETAVIQKQISHGINSPWTSSMGRLFDAAAALAGVRQQVNYEAQAAIEFEALADPEETGAYDFEITAGLVDPAPLIRGIVADVRQGLTAPVISARFHNAAAQMVVSVCRAIRSGAGLDKVALSGGVWQNMTLLHKTVDLLKADGFIVLLDSRVPANDGGIALGQAVIAGMRLKGN